jgi:anthranilate phosphoribosyltransferase
MNKHFKAVIGGKTLSEEQMMEAVSFIMDGRASNDDLTPFLKAMAERGETVDEIVGAAKVMRGCAIFIKSPAGTVDCCGTGGDKSGTYNISTAVSFVVAACGVPVAKHGNRASSSKCGAADILETLGVNLEVSPKTLEESLKLNHFAFLLASRHHPAMKHVAVVRKKLGTPTIFNLLGPLSNPASAQLQLIGVYDRKWVRPLAEALQRLGSKKAWVVHGSDGLDEITVTGDTYVSMLENGAITEKTLSPADFGLKPHAPGDLKGGNATENAQALRSVLEGKKGAYRDIVLANASAVLNIHGSAKTLPEGAKKAAAVIDKGLAMQTLKDYIVFSREQRAQEEKIA